MKNKGCKRLFTIITTIFVVCFSVSFLTSVINYNANKDLVLPVDSFGLIEDQHALEDFSFGIRNISTSGCGVVAIHNYMVLNELPPPNFNELIRIFDIWGENIFATLGVNPFAIATYLNIKGCNVGISFNKNKIKELAKQGGTGIFVYVTMQGGHYSTFTHNSGEVFEFHNPKTNKTFNELFAMIGENSLFGVIYKK